MLANAKLDLAALYVAGAAEFRLASAGRHAAGAGRSAHRGDLKGDEATIETAQLNLSYCYITAPIEGGVGLRQVDPGNLVHAADSGGIMTITQMHPISVVFTLPQRQPAAHQSRRWPKGRLPVHRLCRARTRRELAQGTLLTPDNAIDTSDRHDQAEGHLPQPRRTRLWPGQFVDARLLLAHRDATCGRAGAGGAARAGRALRLCREAGFDRGAAAGRGRPEDGPVIGDHQGAGRRDRRSSSTASRGCRTARGWRRDADRQAAAKTGG